MARFSKRRSPVGQVPASETYDPQLAKLFKVAPSGTAWSHELKFDGYRIGARREGAALRLVSRNRNDWTQQFPEVAQALERLKTERALLDGEVCVMDERGRADFGRLQTLGRDRTGLVYFAFDLLELNGENLRRLSLDERRARLQQIL